MAISVIKRELFTGSPTNVGELNSSSAGSFDAVVGTIPRRRVGAYVDPAQAPGWCGLIKGSDESASSANPTYGVFNVSGNGTFMVCGWIRVKRFPKHSFQYATPISRCSGIITLSDSASGDMSQVSLLGVTVAEKFFSWFNNDTGVTCPRNEDVFVAIVFENVSADSVKYRPYYATRTIPLTPLENERVRNTTGIAIKRVAIGAGWNDFIGRDANQPLWVGTLQAAGLYSLGSMSEVAIPPDLVLPADTQRTWYFNPSTGSDLNDGLAADRAIKSITRSNLDQFCGSIRSRNAAGSGDVLLIDTRTAPLDLDALFKHSIDGGTIAPVGDKIRIDPLLHVAAMTQPNAGTYPNVWSFESTIDGRMYEDGRWMAYVASVSLVNSTAGSYYSDGTNVYVHPFESGNPNTDGHVYDYGRNYSYSHTNHPSTFTNSCVLFDAENGRMEGIECIGGGSSWGFGRESGVDGYIYACSGYCHNFVVEDFVCGKGSKHVDGITGGGNITLRNVTLTQCASGGTIAVDYRNVYEMAVSHAGGYAAGYSGAIDFASYTAGCIPRMKVRFGTSTATYLYVRREGDGIILDRPLDEAIADGTKIQFADYFDVEVTRENIQAYKNGLAVVGSAVGVDGSGYITHTNTEDATGMSIAIANLTLDNCNFGYTAFGAHVSQVDLINHTTAQLYLDKRPGLITMTSTRDEDVADQRADDQAKRSAEKSRFPWISF